MLYVLLVCCCMLGIKAHGACLGGCCVPGSYLQKNQATGFLASHQAANPSRCHDRVVFLLPYAGSVHVGVGFCRFLASWLPNPRAYDRCTTADRTRSGRLLIMLHGENLYVRLQGGCGS
jgi:hypothetical protein